MEALNILETSWDWSAAYDNEADVLYLSHGQPKAALGVDIGEGLVLRVDAETNELVGLTVIGLMNRAKAAQT